MHEVDFIIFFSRDQNFRSNENKIVNLVGPTFTEKKSSSATQFSHSNFSQGS